MDANNIDMLYNQDLMRAVRHLYKTDKITKDKDIVDAMHPYKKNTVSGYITGKIKASPEFRTKFERVFELNLSDFSEDSNISNTRALSGKATITLEDYINELREDKKRLQSTIDTNLTALMQLLTALSRHDRAFHDTILRSLARLEGKKEVDLVAEARSSEAARQIEEMTMSKNNETHM